MSSPAPGADRDGAAANRADRPDLAKQPFDDAGWLFDVKYDGFRALCFLEQWRGHFVSHNGKPLSRFTALADELADVLAVEDAVLDGEVIAPDETGRPRFYDLLRGTTAPTYVAFDLLWLDGADLRSLPLSERRAALRSLLAKGSADPVITEAVSVEGRGCELFELMRAHDLEGIIAKRLADPYGPRTRWLKIKNPDYSQAEGRGELLTRGEDRMSGRARLPAGAPLKASQRGRRRAAPFKVSVNPVWRPGDKVRWRDRIGDFQRDTGDGEHAEIVISGRTYRVRLGDLA